MAKFKKILVIDDDEIVRYLAKEAIDELNLAEVVDEVADGIEGIKYLIENCNDEANCPELILLDINMPHLDGFEFLNLRDKLPAIKSLPSKIVMVSSSGAEKEIEKAKELGVIGYIVKPLTEEKLIKVVGSY